MKDSKKAIITTITAFLLFIIFSISTFALALPYMYNYDWYAREELAGSLDFLIVGASQGQRALYTREIDEVTGSNSYNLSHVAARNFEKDYLLRKELARNNVNTVVFELSYDALSFTNEVEFTSINVLTIGRMDTVGEKFSYFINNVNSYNKTFVYADFMRAAIFGLLGVESPINEEEAYLKGSKFVSETDVWLSDEEVFSTYKQEKFSASTYKEETIGGFTDMIDLCKDQGIRVIVAVVPVADSFLWGMDNLGEFSAWATAYCEKNEVEYYDFNLLKNRYSLFSDHNGYSVDSHHMSEIGSRTFSRVFSEIIQEAKEGKDVSHYFASSYEEIMKDSPYMAIYERGQH